MAKVVIDTDNLQFFNNSHNTPDVKPLPVFVTEVMLENTKLHDENTLLQRMNDKIYDALGLLYTVPSDEAVKLIKEMQAKISLQKRALKDCADREHNDGKTIENLRSVIEMHREEVERVSKVLDLQTNKIMAKDGIIENQQLRLNNQKTTIDDLLAKVAELTEQRDKANKAANFNRETLNRSREVSQANNRELRNEIAALRNVLEVKQEVLDRKRELCDEISQTSKALVKHANDLDEELTKVKDELAGLKWTINNRNREYYEVRGERDLARAAVKALQEDLVKLHNDSKMARAAVQQSIKKLEKYGVFVTSLVVES